MKIGITFSAFDLLHAGHIKMLEESEQPLSGSALAQQLGVSRQIIVSDIALLRAANRDIMATARG